MKTRLLILLPLTVAAGLAATTASAQAISPKLAPGVKPQAGYEAAPSKMVVGNPTPIFSDILDTASHTGELNKIDEPVNVLAQVKGWSWVLVGKNGEGVGYVPLDLLKSAPSRRSKS